MQIQLTNTNAKCMKKCMEIMKQIDSKKKSQTSGLHKKKVL